MTLHKYIVTKMTNSLKIIDFQPSHREAFTFLNKAWIEKRFVLEDVDIKVINDPETYILKNGGAIIMAIYEEKPVGTCALLNKGNGVFEMTKMTVDESYRGLKIGEKLGLGIIEKAKQLNAKKIELFSNKKGSFEAIKLYYKLGFKEIPLDTQAYKRADIKMELVL
jgi:GNAT superfamily N-acetyltransferase